MLERPAVSTRVEVKFIVTLFKAKFMYGVNFSLSQLLRHEVG